MKYIKSDRTLTLSLVIIVATVLGAWCTRLWQSSTAHDDAIRKSRTLIQSDRLAVYDPSVAVSKAATQKLVDRNQHINAKQIVLGVENLFDHALSSQENSTEPLSDLNNIHAKELNESKANLLASVNGLVQSEFNDLKTFKKGLKLIENSKDASKSRERLRTAYSNFLQVVTFSSDPELRLHSLYYLGDISDRLWIDFSIGTPVLFFIGAIQNSDNDLIAEVSWARLKGTIGFRYGGSAGIAEPRFWRELLMTISYLNKRLGQLRILHGGSPQGTKYVAANTRM